MIPIFVSYDMLTEKITLSPLGLSEHRRSSGPYQLVSMREWKHHELNETATEWQQPSLSLPPSLRPSLPPLFELSVGLFMPFSFCV